MMLWMRVQGSLYQASKLVSIHGARTLPSDKSPLYLRVKLCHGMSPSGVESIVLYMDCAFLKGRTCLCCVNDTAQSLIMKLMLSTDIWFC